MSKHTPGPWYMAETEPGIDADVDVFVTTPRYAGGKGLVARVMDADDALLIHAAPDLLDALKFALREVDGFERRTGVPQFATWIAAAKTAIAKAEGSA